MRRLIDAHSGHVEYLHLDEAEGVGAIELVGDVGPVIERNKALARDGGGYAPSGEWRRVASFPPIVIEVVKRLHGADPLARGNEDLLRRLLNDPDLRHFRTSPGRV